MDRKEYLKTLEDLLNDSKEVSPLNYSRLNYDKVEENVQNFLTNCSDETLFGVLMNLGNVEELMQELIEKMVRELTCEATDYYSYLELKEKFGNVENDN